MNARPPSHMEQLLSAPPPRPKPPCFTLPLTHVPHTAYVAPPSFTLPLSRVPCRERLLQIEISRLTADLAALRAEREQLSSAATTRTVLQVRPGLGSALLYL